MARLGGEFFTLALVSIEESRLGDFLGSLQQLEEGGLVTKIRKTSSVEVEGSYHSHAPMSVTVSGADHPGIIQRVARELARRNVNIETMDTNVSSAPMSGAPLFTMKALVFSPTDIPFADLSASLEQLGSELAVDIELEQNRGGD